MAFEHIAVALSERQKQGLLRQTITIESQSDVTIRVAGKSYINFSGNDYLGMSQHPELAAVFGQSECSGAASSPVITGYSKHHEALAEYLKQITGQPAVMFFTSGFAANHAICQTLLSGKQSLILADKLSHASIIDGALCSEATFKRFAHNDLDHLDRLLQTATSICSKDILVVSEGTFSMDGDRGPVAQLLQKAEAYDAWLMIDFAHSIGCQPPSQIFEYVFDDKIKRPQLLMATFGKAVGTGGAFVAASEEVIQYLQNFARHYIYSTAFSPAHAQATLMSLKLIEEEPWRREKLLQNIHLFRELCGDAGITILASDSAIQPVIIGDPAKAMKLSQTLKDNGFWVTAIRYPTVPKNTDRLRITLTASHQEQHIENLVSALQEALTTPALVTG